MARTKWARSATSNSRLRRSRSGNRSRKPSATTRRGIEEETATGARRTIGTTGFNPTPSTTMIQTSGLVHFGKRNEYSRSFLGLIFRKSFCPPVSFRRGPRALPRGDCRRPRRRGDPGRQRQRPAAHRRERRLRGLLPRLRDNSSSNSSKSIS